MDQPHNSHATHVYAVHAGLSVNALYATDICPKNYVLTDGHSSQTKDFCNAAAPTEKLAVYRLTEQCTVPCINTQRHRDQGSRLGAS